MTSPISGPRLGASLFLVVTGSALSCAEPNVPRQHSGPPSCLDPNAQYRPVPPPQYDRPLRDAADRGVVVVQVAPDRRRFDPVPGCELLGVRYDLRQRPPLQCLDRFSTEADVSARFAPYSVLTGGIASDSSYEFGIQSNWVMESPRRTMSITDIAPGCRSYEPLYFVRGLELGALAVATNEAQAQEASLGTGSFGASASGRNQALRAANFGGPQCAADPRQCVVVRVWLEPLDNGVGCQPGYSSVGSGDCAPDPTRVLFDVQIAIHGPGCDDWSGCDYRVHVGNTAPPLEAPGGSDSVAGLPPTRHDGAELRQGLNVKLIDRDLIDDDVLGTCILTFSDQILRELAVDRSGDWRLEAGSASCGNHHVSAKIRRAP